MSATTIEASRQLVLTRLGAPRPLLPGARYRHDSPRCWRVDDRYGRYFEESAADPTQELERFIAFLEGEREHDYQAFHYGRELLLEDLPVHVEYPREDPEPGFGPTEPTPASPRKLPRWSRRKAAKPTKQEQAAALSARLRARVLERLGRPRGSLPGEATVLTSSPAVDEISAQIDELAHRTLSEAAVDEAIDRIAALRERDWQAFCHGRDELLSLLPIELEPSADPDHGMDAP
jgi:hypothetical protein